MFSHQDKFHHNCIWGEVVISLLEKQDHNIIKFISVSRAILEYSWVRRNFITRKRGPLSLTTYINNRSPTKPLFQSLHTSESNWKSLHFFYPAEIYPVSDQKASFTIQKAIKYNKLGAVCITQQL
jgi:hypothetical protein